MVQKRLLKKLPLIRKEITPPLMYGSSNPEIVLVGWGSTYGVVREAVDVLSQSRSMAMLHFSEIYPFPSAGQFDYMTLNNAKLSICVENNATGQFAHLMKAETGFECKAKINRYDGRPFTLEGLLGEINAHIGRL
jgi:2-oxoglutarate ferredoxin oxidoreductase subunit alpha